MGKSADFDREKKIHKVVKGTNKVDKHRKNIYNMLSELEEDDFVFDDKTGNVRRNYSNHSYDKQR